MEKLLVKEGLSIERNKDGIPVIHADTEELKYYGLGYCQAYDRGSQLLLMKILGRGKASEHLQSSDQMLEIDKFFRRMNWHSNIDKEISEIEPEVLKAIQAFSDGINDVYAQRKPWEFKWLLGFKDFTWTIQDSIIISRMSGYLTLAQSHGEIERFFLQLVKKGVKKELLEELFPGILDAYDEEIIKNLHFDEKIIPEAIKWNISMPTFMASNNWVVAGSKTLSGKPILANDPHLEINRSPSIWYETITTVKDATIYGVAMVGMPFFLLGRNQHIAVGVTYAFMDAIDSWIEHCKDGKYLKDGEWKDFEVRKETIKRKKKEAVEVLFYDNDHGTLDGTPKEDGYYLSTRWSGDESGAQTFNTSYKLWSSTSVKEGMGCVSKIESAGSWVIADIEGNIGFQMSGLMPKRGNNHKGFVPLEGWKSENDWQGYHDPKGLPNNYNPEEGYITTANHNLNDLGELSPITIAMGPYRANRISNLLSREAKVDVNFCKDLQYDTYSTQADLFMPLLLPLLPATPNGSILKEWDHKYDINSKGAYLFEEVYKNIILQVFGEILGVDVVDYAQTETGVFIDFYENFDNILLKEESLWFGQISREEHFRKAIEAGLYKEAKEWGEVNTINLTNIILGESMPGFMGFNEGPVSIPGGRATVHQGQIYRSAGRKTTFLPSVRMIADMGDQSVYANLAWGVSDRRFSKLYNNDKENWINGTYRRYEL